MMFDCLLSSLVKEGIATKEVMKYARNQVKTRKVPKCNDYIDIVKFEMTKKIKDSKNDENNLRQRRKDKRKELRKLVDPQSQKFQKIMDKLESKKQRIMKNVKMKNKEKLDSLRLEQLKIGKPVSTSLPEECEQYKDLKVFTDKEIKPGYWR